jgi:hypothetical protein
MQKLRNVTALLFAAMVLACAGLEQSNYDPDDGSIPYISIYFKQTEGQVGYHMSNPLWGSWGYGGHSVSWSLESLTITSGSLPPGLRMDWDKIVGTPTQAGEWYLSYSYSITAKRSGMSKPQSGNFNVTIKIRGSGDFGGSGFSGSGTLEIVNQCPHDISVQYTGPQNGTVQVPANGTISLNLRSGRYSLYSTAPGQNVNPLTSELTLYDNQRLRNTIFLK